MLVYIAEAHAADEWPINSTRCAGPGNTLLAHTTLAERTQAAARMLKALRLEGVPLLCDGMDDAFLRSYAAWPIRMYGVAHGRVEIVAEPRHARFELSPFCDWLLAPGAP